MVASHTAAPLGAAKWLGKRYHTPGTLPLGKGQEPLMSPTQGQAILLGGISVPAISKHLKAFLYGWLPLSDASGIIIVNCPTAFSLITVFVCFLWHPFLANRPLYAAQRHPLCWLPLSDADRHPFLANRSLYSAHRHLLCDCASTILFLLLYSFVNVYYLSLVSAKNAEGMKRIQAGGEVRSTEPLLRVRKQISAEGTTESLSPHWGFTHSCLPCRGFATLHHLPVFCRPFQD